MQLHALIVSGDRFEDSELLVPKEELEAAGVAVDIASREKGSISGKHGHRVEAGLAVADADPERYDLLVLPGGKAPAVLRNDPSVLTFVRRFMASGKPVAAVCHGPQILQSAGVLQGRKATCYREVAGELEAAGADYRDEEVVVDGNLITSRSPKDLPAFTKEILHALNRQVKRVAAHR